MGNTTPQKINQRVVIVGGSFAGLTVAMKLWDIFEVVIIDQKDFFEYICTVPRAITQPDFYEKLVTPYEEMLQGNQNKAQFIQAALVRVENDRSISIKKQGKEDTELLEYDYLVICTGSEYKKPIKDAQAVTLADRQKGISEEIENIRKADSVLVVGAGAVGVEAVGELQHAFRDSRDTKRIGIVTRGETLLPYFPQNAQVAAMAFFQRNGVTMHLGESYDEAFREKYNYQHIIQCAGLTFNTEFMHNEQFGDCVSPRGQIFVNRNMQVTNENPLEQQRPSKNKEGILPRFYRNIFSLGDVCLTSLNEEKAIYPLKEMAKIVVHNIIALGQGSNILQTLPEQMAAVYGITLGPEFGLFVINDFVMTGRMPANMKDEIQELNIRLHRGDERAKREVANQQKQTGCLFCCCNRYLCCCCPCSTKRRRTLRQEKKYKKNE